MEELDIFTWDITSSLAYIISQSHIPKEARPALTKALIAEIETYDYEDPCKIYETFAMAIISMGTEDAVTEALKDKSLKNKEKENLKALQEAITTLSEKSDEEE